MGEVRKIEFPVVPARLRAEMSHSIWFVCSILSHLSENPTSWFGNVLPLSPAVRRYASSGAASAPFLSQLSLLARARPPGPLHAAPDPDLVALYRSARVPAPLPEPVTWEMRMAQR